MQINIIKLFFDAKLIECDANKTFAFETKTQTRPKHNKYKFNITLMIWKMQNVHLWACPSNKNDTTVTEILS